MLTFGTGCGPKRVVLVQEFSLKSKRSQSIGSSMLYVRFVGKKDLSLGVNLHTSVLTVILEIFGLKLAGYPSQRDAPPLLL